MRHIMERIEALPVEDWAAAAGQTFRRTKRRLARRKARVAVAGVFALAVAAVGGNALWSQTGAHPAPLWGHADPAAVAIATHGSDGAVVRQASEGPDVDISDMVTEVQAGLAASGFYEGPANGELDAATEDAIRAFERSAGLPETGEPSLSLIAAVTAAQPVEEPGPEQAGPPTEMAALVEAAAPQPAEVPGSVADIQRLLNGRGYGPLDVDGQMGRRTRSALDAFAQDSGLGERDGLSPEVLRALAGG